MGERANPHGKERSTAQKDRDNLSNLYTNLPADYFPRLRTTRVTIGTEKGQFFRVRLVEAQSLGDTLLAEHRAFVNHLSCKIWLMDLPIRPNLELPGIIFQWRVYDHPGRKRKEQSEQGPGYLRVLLRPSIRISVGVSICSSGLPANGLLPCRWGCSKLGA